MKLTPYAIPGLKLIAREREDMIACEIFGITLDQLYSNSRKREIVDCRNALIYYWRIIRRKTLVESAGIYNKDHGTAINAVRTVSDLIETNKDFKEKLNEFLDKIKPRSG